MVEMDSDFNKVLENYINRKREILEEGIFLSSDYLSSDKHLQFYRDMSELASVEDAWEALKASRQRILKEGEKSMSDIWIQEEDTDSWNLILEMEKDKYV